MMQVRIYEYSKEKQWKLINRIWNKLPNVEFPHFLFEHGYLLFRFHEQLKPELEKLLKNYKTEYLDEWDEWSDVIKDNMAEFAYILTNYSSLAIKNANNKNFNTSGCLERICHCAYNMLSQLLTYQSGEKISESMFYTLLARRVALGEGYLVGKYSGELDDKPL